MTHDPSDFERDEVLGRALRRALEPPGGAEAFAARVRARFEPPRERAWQTLASWSRWGVIAAAAVLLVALVALLPRSGNDASVEAALAASNTEAAAQLMIEEDSPGAAVLLAEDD
jgi:hypothetical protein